MQTDWLWSTGRGGVNYKFSYQNLNLVSPFDDLIRYVKKGWKSHQCKPWSDCSSRNRLIWVYTVWSGISVRKCSINTINVNVLKFATVVACHKSLEKQGRPRSDCFWRSILIGLFHVCFSDRHFVSSSPDITIIIFENKKRKLYKILEHLL